MPKLCSSKQILTLFLLMIAGCEKQSYIKAEYIEGYFNTSEKKYRFKNISKKNAKKMLLPNYDRHHGSYLIAGNDDVTIAYCSACSSSKISIYLDKKYLKKQAIFKVESQHAQYKIGEVSYKPMLIKRDEDGHRNKNGTISNIEHLITQTRIRLALDGPGETHGDIGRIKFAFNIDEASYNVDLSLKVERSNRLKWSIGIPGIP